MQKRPDWLHSLTTRILGQLEEDQLKLLMPSLETEGGDVGPCVPLLRDDIEVPAWGIRVSPHIVFMMYYRWKDFPQISEAPPPMKSLPWCSNSHDHALVCVNPYHWTMLLNSELSDSFYDPHAQNYDAFQLSRDISMKSEYSSLETGGTNFDYEGRKKPWCRILYWEGNERKGSVFPVIDSMINVLGDTPHGSGLSLASFFSGIPRDDRIQKTRKKICQGLVLWREGQSVWVYNRSEVPVYLNSASLDGSFYNLNLYKCPPGHAMIIYYYEMASALMELPEYTDKCQDKADVNSVRISFAKGWGKNYHRREILCCPCWIEVHIMPSVKVEQRTPPR